MIYPRRTPKKETNAEAEPPLPIETECIMSLHPDMPVLVAGALAAVLQYRLFIHGSAALRPKQNAEEIVAEFCYDNKMTMEDWSVILSYVIRLARTMPEYNGITDPRTQRKCAKCRKVRPLSAFHSHTLTCAFCTEDE